MTTEFGMQAAQVGFNLIDGLGNMWADKAQEKKIKEDLQEQRELEESYRERILGITIKNSGMQNLDMSQT